MPQQELNCNNSQNKESSEEPEFFKHIKYKYLYHKYL